MDFWKREGKSLALIVGGFLASYYLPVGRTRFDHALTEGFQLLRWYAREHFILCLLPAFFIAGAISVFVNQASVIKYFGPRANKLLAYSVASVSGTILAVCSCTVLPLFAGIYKMGAGLGPATAFLYSGPAINVLAIILTARILGFKLGAARAVGAVSFAVLIGLLMAALFRREPTASEGFAIPPDSGRSRSLGRTALFFAAMIAVLVFANWGRPAVSGGIWNAVYEVKWEVTAVSAAALAVMLAAWYGVSPALLIATSLAVLVAAWFAPGRPQLAFGVGLVGLGGAAARARGEAGEWFVATWGYTKQITPLLLGGVWVAGFLLGRPGEEGVIPSGWVSGLVGGNSLAANFYSSLVGALMYFATLTEVPILQGLIGSGMGKGPALALLLAGPALSLPSMLVIRSILGTKKTLAYVTLVVIMATVAGLGFGALVF